MSWESRQKRQKQRYEPYRMNRRIWVQQIRLLFKTVLYAVSFMTGCALLALTMQAWEIYQAGLVGYWMIALYGIGTSLRVAAGRIVQMGWICFGETRRQRRIMQRYNRIQGL